MRNGSNIAAIILAAGRSTRMGHFKLLADIAGQPMLRRIVMQVLASNAGSVIVVTGHEAEAVRAALGGLDVAFTHNPRFAEGLSTSLAAGISALADDAEGALVVLGDMPGITAAILDRLLADFEPGSVVVPVRNGEMGNPMLWPREAFAAMVQLTGDAGARRLLPRFEGRVRYVDVADDGILADVDTPEALAAHRAKLPPSP